MSNYNCYKIIPEKKLILEHYSGIILIQNIINQKIKISNEKDYNPNFDLIHDFRKAEFQISEEDGLYYLNFLMKNKILYSKRKVVHLTNTPEQVAITTLFSMLKDEPNINTQTVSTIEAALVWLGHSINDMYVIEAYFNELK